MGCFDCNSSGEPNDKTDMKKEGSTESEEVSWSVNERSLENPIILSLKFLGWIRLSNNSAD